jgi:endonuclease/exonuclease/phosphatase family metal-dependent hydrolase
LPWSGYLGRTSSNLKAIIEFIRSLDPDIMGLVEVDEGSYRARRRNQAEIIAEELGHYHVYESKYGVASFTRRLPIFSKQGNAFLSRDTIANERFHYFEQGVKRLVIELELENLTIFLVHLALTFRTRQHQLSDLYELVKGTPTPHIVAGDFNAHWGDREIDLFLAATGLANSNATGMPSFPSRAPKRQLDFILHSPEIESRKLWIPNVTYSDHLPLVWDFEMR